MPKSKEETLKKFTHMKRLIHLHLYASAAEHPYHEICVTSPDTDVFILLIDFVSHGLLALQTHMKFLTGKGRKYREIDIP